MYNISAHTLAHTEPIEFKFGIDYVHPRGPHMPNLVDAALGVLGWGNGENVTAPAFCFF